MFVDFQKIVQIFCFARNQLSVNYMCSFISFPSAFLKIIIILFLFFNSICDLLNFSLTYSPHSPTFQNLIGEQTKKKLKCQRVVSWMFGMGNDSFMCLAHHVNVFKSAYCIFHQTKSVRSGRTKLCRFILPSDTLKLKGDGQKKLHV